MAASARIPSQPIRTPNRAPLSRRLTPRHGKRHDPLLGLLENVPPSPFVASRPVRSTGIQDTG